MSYKSRVTNKYMGATFAGRVNASNTSDATDLINILQKDVNPAISRIVNKNIENKKDEAVQEMNQLLTTKDINTVQKEILEGKHPKLSGKYVDKTVQYHRGKVQAIDAIKNIEAKFKDKELHLISVKSQEVSVKDAINTYLFNTQIITLPNGDMAIIAPSNCAENQAVANYLDQLITLNTPIKAVKYFDVKQSMQNGGGPACLRLRVAMTEQELSAVNPQTLLNDKQFGVLNQWVDKHYRDRLSIHDLPDPQLLIESRTALDELTQIMQLGSVYPFQQI